MKIPLHISPKQKYVCKRKHDVDMLKKYVFKPFVMKIE